MTTNKMYSERVGNIPVMRYCKFKCVYCGFQKFLGISNCQDCRDNKNHSHLEVLQRTPPKTKPGQFLTIGLSGDVSFCSHDDLVQISSYCAGWPGRTFLIQSKNPAVFLEHYWPDNVILGTTIETNILAWSSDNGLESYDNISKAPIPEKRYEAMKTIRNRKAITIEPILSFDSENFIQWIEDIGPEFVYIGYANDKHEGKKLKLPEPSLEKTMRLIAELRGAGIEVRTKTLRKAWYE